MTAYNSGVYKIVAEVKHSTLNHYFAFGLIEAYDRSKLMATIMPYFPAFPTPTAMDSSSFDNLKAFFTKTMGVTMPDEEIRSTTVFSKDGKYQKDVTPGEITGKIMTGVEAPNYQSITCPALSIYAIPNSIHTALPFYDLLDNDNKTKADTLFTISTNIVKEQIAMFRKEVKNGMVKEIQGANHYVFISNPVETQNLILEFLK